MKTPARGYAARRNASGPFRMSPALIVVLFLVVAFGALWAFRVIDPLSPFSKAEVSHRGQIAIPVSAVAIPAYTKINRDHLWNKATGNFAVIWLRPEQVSPEMFRTLNDVIGRVLDHDKAPQYAFTEADFFPKGTRAGMVAGIPAGKRAMRIPAERAPGLIGLQLGDRFDLVATIPIDPAAASGLGAGGLYGKQIDMQARMLNLQKQATVRVVVQNGSIVEPMQTRQVPVASSTMTSGLVVRTKPVQEVVIAVGPVEVARLTEALAVGAELACVPRSGRPDDPVGSYTPESTPVSPYGAGMRPSPYAPTAPPPSAASDDEEPVAPSRPVRIGPGFMPIESISGGKREIVAAPVKR